jgi:hypothetical protein
MKKLSLLTLILLAACGDLPGPSVPMQQGQTLGRANAAIRACAPVAPRGGDNAVAGGYVGGVLLGGILLGPIIVANNEDAIRANGEASAVDRCLAKQGFMRRNLTDAEVAALKASGPERRRVILDHLINGGSLDTLGTT